MKKFLLLPAALLLSSPAFAAASDMNVEMLAYFNKHAAVDCGDSYAQISAYGAPHFTQGGATWTGGGGSYLKFKIMPRGYIADEQKIALDDGRKYRLEVRAIAYDKTEVRVELRFEIISAKGEKKSASTFATVPRSFLEKETSEEIQLEVGINGTVPEEILDANSAEADAMIKKLDLKGGDFVNQKVHCYINRRE